MKYWFKRLSYLIREKTVFSVLTSHFKHIKKKQFPKRLPEISINEIVGHTDFIISNDKFEDGNISNLELECICKIVKYLDPKKIFEIGTYDGRTTLNMAANTSPETNIYTLDLPKDEVSKTKLRIKSGEKVFIDKPASGVRFIGTPYEDRIFQIYSDSAKFDYSEFTNKMDFVFIDGSHSYEYVINDTHIAYQLLRDKGGVIIWHDYGWNEVIQALNEFYQKDARFKNLKNIKGTSFAYLKVE